MEGAHFCPSDVVFLAWSFLSAVLIQCLILTECPSTHSATSVCHHQLPA